MNRFLRHLDPSTLVCLAGALLLGLAPAACSGSSGGGNTTAAEPSGAHSAGGVQDGAGGQGAGDSSTRQLRKAQEAAISAMCERLVNCGVEDARKTMKPEEVKKLDLPHLVPRARAKCEDDYNDSQLSPRQVKVVQDCVNRPGSCAQLSDCLDAAKKKPGEG